MELAIPPTVSPQQAILNHLQEYHAGKWVGTHMVYRAFPLLPGTVIQELLTELHSGGLIEREMINNTFPVIRYIPVTRQPQLWVIK